VLLELDNDFFKKFIHPIPEMSHWHEDLQGRPNLLVTLGDSWTWGDSLGTTDHARCISDPHRLEMVYGRHLQDLMGDCDWINIGFPGIANYWIIDVAERIQVMRHRTGYEKILISIGLTDLTRDIAQFGLREDRSLRETARQYEHAYLDRLHRVESESDIVIVLGRNFTDTLPGHQDLIRHHLPRRWVDISWEIGSGELGPPSPVLGHLIPQDVCDTEKEWVINEVMLNSLLMAEFLESTPVHYNRATKHPREHRHRAWAQYVWDYVLDKKLW
jgi:hypothetical protein